MKKKLLSGNFPRPNEQVEQAASPEPIADSPKVAAKRCGIGRVKLYAEIAAGRLRSVKCGKRRLIPRDAQAEWLANLPAN